MLILNNAKNVSDAKNLVLKKIIEGRYLISIHDGVIDSIKQVPKETYVACANNIADVAQHVSGKHSDEFVKDFLKSNKEAVLKILPLILDADDYAEILINNQIGN